MDKMREEFEAWCCGKLVLRLFGDNYDNSSTQLAWLAWKASRAALCVEFPHSWIVSELGDDANVFEVVDVMTSLDEAGVQYK